MIKILVRQMGGGMKKFSRRFVVKNLTFLTELHVVLGGQLIAKAVKLLFIDHLKKG